MEKTFTNNCSQVNSFRNGWVLLVLLVFAMQASFAQDFDFQQGDDEHALVVMEAENYSSNEPVGDVMWSTTDSPEGYSGDGAMMAVTGAPFATKEDAMAGSAILTYKINFTEIGTHYIWARASRTGGGDDSYHAGIDGEITDSSAFLTFHKTTFTAGTWGWINFRNNIGPANVDIYSKGVHELNLYIRENGFRIDKIILTISDTNDFKPDSLGPDETLRPTGINSVSPENDILSVYPNPTDNQLNVQFKNLDYSNGILKIVDLQGKLIKTEILDGNLSKVIDISHLAPGVYLLQLEQNDKLVSVNRILKF